jgi:drug/metabolite transporter (DMT)-like permease
LIAAVALILNYVSNVKGLLYIAPEVAQVVMQLAPFLLMLGGVLFFGESMSRKEKVGAGILLAGLLCFFNQDLMKLLRWQGDYAIGVALIGFAAFMWGTYALLQKKLLSYFSSKQLNLMNYALGVAILLPVSSLDSVMQMNTLQLGALIFCCFNTLIAYGAFAEALDVWQASKVSMVIALTPLFTFASMELAVLAWPDQFAVRNLSWLAYLGAAMVILGSMLAALGKQSEAAKSI